MNFLTNHERIQLKSQHKPEREGRIRDQIQKLDKGDMLDMLDKEKDSHLSTSFRTSHWTIDPFSTSEVRIPKIASVRKIRSEEEAVEQPIPF